MAGLLENMTPQQMGLLQAGLGMMAAPRYVPAGGGLMRATGFGEQFGSGALQGLQAMQQQQQLNAQNEIRQAQIAKMNALAQQEQADAAKNAQFEAMAKNIDVKKLKDPAYKANLYRELGMYKELLKQSEPGEKVLFNDATQGGFVIDKLTGQPMPLTYEGRQLRAAPYDVGLAGDLAGARKRQSEAESIIKVPTETGQEQYIKKGEALSSETPNTTNFGNLRPKGKNTGFQSFATPEEGLAAVSDNIRAYGSKHGINTITGLVNRWAPASDKNNVPAYIEHLSQVTGFSPDQEIDLNDPVVNHLLTTGIIKHEGNIPKYFGQSTSDKSMQAEEGKLQAKRQAEIQKETESAPAIFAEIDDQKRQIKEALSSLDKLGGGQSSFFPTMNRYIDENVMVDPEASLANRIAGSEILKTLSTMKGASTERDVIFSRLISGLDPYSTPKDQLKKNYLQLLNELDYKKEAITRRTGQQTNDSYSLSTEAMMLPKAQREELKSALDSGNMDDIKEGLSRGFYKKNETVNDELGIYGNDKRPFKNNKKPDQHSSVIVR